MRIKSISPTRISIFGGGTDIPNYYQNCGGAVISMAINLRQEIIMEYEEDMYKGGHDKFPIYGDPQFAYSFLKEYGVDDGLHLTRLNCSFEGIIGAGLGSSGSFAVGLVSALSKRAKRPLNRQEIAEEAWDIESNKIGLFTGKQDHYAAALGGLRYYEFKTNNSVYNFAFSKSTTEKLKSYLLLFYTGTNRQSKTIQDKFKNLDETQLIHLNKIKNLTLNGMQYISSHNWKGVANLLKESWEHKKASNHGVSNDHLDSIYDAGIKQGAMAGKVLGAGGGGFFLFMVEPDRQDNFIKQMEKIDLINWDFSPDYSGVETRILP